MLVQTIEYAKTSFMYKIKLKLSLEIYVQYYRLPKKQFRR